MNYVTLLIELWVLLLGCSAAGRVLIKALPNSMQVSIGFYLIPLLGVAFFMLLSTSMGWFLPFQFQYTLLAAMAVLCIALCYETQWVQWLQDSAILVLFATLCSLPVLSPVLHYGTYNPFTDIFTYLAQSQWLQTHPFSQHVEGSGYFPYLTQVSLYQISGSRMGGSFFLAFVQSLFHLPWSYHAYLPVVSLVFTTGCLAIGGILHQVLSLKRWMILALCLLPSFSMNGFVFGAEWGFYPQTCGLALAVGVVALLAALTQSMPKILQTAMTEPLRPQACRFSPICRRFSLVWLTLRYCLPAALCSATLLLAYNEPFLIFAAAIGLFMCISLYAACDHRAPLLLFFGIYLLETLLLTNYETLRIARNLLQTLSVAQGQAAIGWPVKWSFIQFLAFTFGMKTPFTNTSGIFRYDHFISVYVFALTSLGSIALLITPLRQVASKKLPPVVLLLLCIELMLGVAFIKLRYFSPNASPGEIGLTFLQFKIAKYAAPFSLSLFAIALGIIWQYYKKWRSFCIGTYLSLMLVGLFLHYHYVAKAGTQHFLDETQTKTRSFDALLILRDQVADLPSSDVIHVDVTSAHSKLRQMIIYILFDRKLSGDYRDDGYLLGKLPPSERNMPMDNANWLILLKHAPRSCGKVVKQTDLFSIQQAPFHCTS